MVIVIIGVLAWAMSPFIIASFESWALHKIERDLTFSARLSMGRMFREIRRTKDLSSITTFTSSEFEFQDNDSNTIIFQQLETSLLRNSNELTDKLQNPGGLAFSYLDSSGVVTAIKGDIRMIKVTLILQSGANSITVESLVRIRNIN